jgi:hypothetical protein
LLTKQPCVNLIALALPRLFEEDSRCERRGI